MTKENSKQKFIIEPGGKIVIEWINPDFSDVIIETVYTEVERKELDSNTKIWCG